eukprot:NODE_707_length_1398_cov_324.051378.p1 GENE.NODE_707_length_1398_cov_324.051378~~NODE_707_length_1398_cov_324.051378.p1  ORF type:complete len:344 (-),score=59.24 NODE_707_length_1398_cov_324.051378:209-1240(-)
MRMLAAESQLDDKYWEESVVAAKTIGDRKVGAWTLRSRVDTLPGGAAAAQDAIDSGYYENRFVKTKDGKVEEVRYHEHREEEDTSTIATKRITRGSGSLGDDEFGKKGIRMLEDSSVMKRPAAQEHAQTTEEEEEEEGVAAAAATDATDKDAMEVHGGQGSDGHGQRRRARKRPSIMKRPADKEATDNDATNKEAMDKDVTNKEAMGKEASSGKEAKSGVRLNEQDLKQQAEAAEQDNGAVNNALPSASPEGAHDARVVGQAHEHGGRGGHARGADEGDLPGRPGQQHQGRGNARREDLASLHGVQGVEADGGGSCNHAGDSWQDPRGGQAHQRAGRCGEEEE